VVAHVSAGGRRGFGYTYADSTAAQLIEGKLAPLLAGRDAFATAECWDAMVRAVRNLGATGLCSVAISAVDSALWDLKGKLLEAPVITLLGRARARLDCGRVPVAAVESLRARAAPAPLLCCAPRAAHGVFP
jgi:L-alanine-DL-glutamate epimerase-like enolase superfamily enzyme